MEWLKDTGINKTAVRIDMSTDVLQGLLCEGYNRVTWHSNPDAEDDVCKALDGTVWTLSEFLENLNYNAPLYEKSHVACLCEILVYSDDLSKPEVRVNWMGAV